LEKEYEELMLSAFKENEKVLFQFSGGKDSQAALEIVLPYAKKLGIPYEAAYVDTGAEFPSVTKYVKEYTKKRDIPLVILQHKSIVDEIYRLNKFPHPIYKDCISSIINYPVNKYARKEKALVVTGHHPKQRQGTKKARMKFVYYIPSAKITTLNPLYVVEPPELEEIWDGYAKGFSRTACYCCPFQKEPQWEAMKKEFPELWEKMAKIISEIPICALDDRKSQGICVYHMTPYWQDKHGIRIQKIFYGKKE
jgi:hypothetical protein